MISLRCHSSNFIISPSPLFYILGNEMDAILLKIGCVQPTIVQPPETNKQVNAGGTFQLTCKAVAIPEPYINWRLNWGPVCDPPRCTQHSEGGLGTLTVTNAQYVFIF